MKNYFNFSKKDKIGTVVLFSAILATIVVLNIGKSVYVPNPFEVDQSKLTYFTYKQDSIQQEKQKRFSYANTTNETTGQLTNFDPNTLSQSGWENLGFSEKQAASILKFKRTIGRFDSKQQLADVYVISKEKFDEIEPFIQIKQVRETKKQPWVDTTSNKDNKAEPIIQIKLNKATKEELMQIKGIGPYYADQVLEFRQKTGGFVEESQIDEIYMAEEAKEILKQAAIINPLDVQKTNINTASKQQLKAIPYTNWVVVSKILKARDAKSLTDLNFLSDTDISPANLDRMTYYIGF